MSLPPGWSLKPLRDVVTFNPRHDRTLPDSLGVSFVPMPVVSATGRDLLPHSTRPLGEVRKGYTHFCDGDVLFAKITPCMENGKAALARNLINGVGCGTTELHVMRPGNELIPEWLYFYVWREPFRKEAELNMTGTAGQLRVPLAFLEAQDIPVPASIEEQRHITGKLDRIMARLDEVKIRLTNIPALIKRFRQSILAAACSGRLTEVWRRQNPSATSTTDFSEPSHDDLPELPRSWRYASLGSLLHSTKYGTAKKCSYKTAAHAVLRIPNIGEGRITGDDLKFADLPEREYQQLALEPGDLLLIRSNGSVSLVGRAALVTSEFAGYAYAGYLIRLRPKTEMVLPEYLNRVLASFPIRLQIEIPARSTSGVNNINSEEVANLRIPLPSLSEQLEIVRRVEDLMRQADTIEARYDKALAFVDKLMPSILAKAFRGELS